MKRFFTNTFFYVCQTILKGPGIFWKRATIHDETCELIQVEDILDICLWIIS